MKAPDSVYLVLNVFGNVIKDQWQFHRLHDDDIEYIRADTFIERAAEWFFEIENGTTITDIDKFVEDFKKAMKEK